MTPWEIIRSSCGTGWVARWRNDYEPGWNYCRHWSDEADQFAITVHEDKDALVREIRDTLDSNFRNQREESVLHVRDARGRIVRSYFHPPLRFEETGDEQNSVRGGATLDGSTWVEGHP